MSESLEQLRDDLADIVEWLKANQSSPYRLIAAELWIKQAIEGTYERRR